MLGPRFTVGFSIGEIRRKGNLFIGEFLSGAHPTAVGLAAFDFDLTEPRLRLVGPGIPGVFRDGEIVFGVVALPAVHARFIGVFIADGIEVSAIVVEVVVVLTTVKSEVTGGTHHLGQRLHAVGQMNAQFFGNDDAVGSATGAVLVRAVAGLHYPGDDCRAAGRTHRGGRKGPGKEHALRGEIINRRGVLGVDRIAVATHVGRKIFGEDPENIGTTHISCSGSAERNYTKEKETE